ncbi:MAG: bleomycin resistance protein [Cyanobacteria bacterium CAN_BIN43]|nr:bleomycin resistance protein [Cyanobacteria bacterium CAN_BIN43]
MNFYRIEHLNKICQNLEATLQFYQTLFPDWFVRDRGGWENVSWIHFGNRQFYLSLYERRDALQSIPLDTGNIDHVGFVIEDGEKMIAVLEANGIEYFVEESPETKYRIYVSDPDSTGLELVEYHQNYELR